MKTVILCLCLITLAFAIPVHKSRHHEDGSTSAEGRHDSRKHHHHHHEHKHDHHHSHSEEHGRSHESHEQHASSQLSAPSSEESEEITEQQTLLVPAPISRSLEDDDNHSDVDDDDDDHSDSDESDEGAVTDFPNDSTFTPTDSPYTLEPFTGRGDSAPYRGKANVKLVHLEKAYKKSRKFDSHDGTDDFDSTPDVESHETYSRKVHSLERHDTSIEKGDTRDLKHSNEVHSASHERSLENISHQSLESVEDDHDDGDHDNSRIAASLESHESKELQKDYHDGLQQVAHRHDVDDVSNQTLESAEDHHSVENHHSVEDHSTEHHHSVEDHHSIENHSTENHHSAEDRRGIEDNEVIL